MDETVAPIWDACFRWADERKIGPVGRDAFEHVETTVVPGSGDRPVGAVLASSTAGTQHDSPLILPDAF